MMTPEQAAFAAIMNCIAGSLLSLAASRNKAGAGWVAFAITAVSSILIFFACEKVLVAGALPRRFELRAMAPVGVTFGFRVDELAALFLMLAAFIALLAVFYSTGYMRHYSNYGVARYSPNFLLFVGGMYGLLSTTDMVWVFFVFWQLMTLPIYGLIRFEHRQPGNCPSRRAAAPWRCGYALDADCNRYVAHNFYGEIKRYFRWLGGRTQTTPIGQPATRKLV